MKRYLIVFFAILTISCEHKIPNPILSEQNLLVFDESFAAKPVTINKGFASLTKKNDVYFLTTIDTIGNIDHILEMTDYLPENESIDSLDKVLFQYFEDTNFLLFFNKKDTVDKSNHFVLLQVSESGNVLQHIDKTIIDTDINFVSDIFIDRENKLALLASNFSSNTIFQPRLLTIHFNGSQNQIIKNNFPTTINNQSINSTYRILSNKWVSFWEENSNDFNSIIYMYYIIPQNEIDKQQNVKFTNASIDIITISDDNKFIVTGKEERDTYFIKLYDERFDEILTTYTLFKPPGFSLNSISETESKYYFCGTNYLENNFSWQNIFNNESSLIETNSKMFYFNVSKENTTQADQDDIEFAGEYPTVAGAIKTSETGIYLIGACQSFGILNNIILWKQ